MTHDGLYIIIPAVSTLFNGTLVVALGPWVLEWSPSPHEGLDTLYKETCSPGADCCSIAPLREAAQWSLSGARGFSGWSLVTYQRLLLIVLFDSTSTIASIFPTNLDLIKMKEFLECAPRHG